MIFFFLLLVLMFAGLVVQHFIGPVPVIDARVLLMQMVMLYGALAMPLPGMLALTFAGGLMWDALHTQWIGDSMADGQVEIAMGWSIILYAALGTIMNGFRPLFLRGRWEIHCLLTGACTSVMVLAEYLMLTVRRQPIHFIFNSHVAWKIGGAGLLATLLAPLFFFIFNYLALLTGFDPQPERHGPKNKKR
jgi:hypothetical protein